MKKNKLFSIIFSLALSLFPLFGIAQTYETNVTTMVVKNVYCNQYGYVNGDLINRSANNYNGSVKLVIVDKDGDIAWQGGEKISVGPLSGQKFSIHFQAGSCAPPNRMAFKVE